MTEDDHRIEIAIDSLLAERGLSASELADQIGLAYPNLSILKNQRARAIRFSTLTRLCEALDCEPGDLIRLRDD